MSDRPRQTTVASPRSGADSSTLSVYGSLNINQGDLHVLVPFNLNYYYEGGPSSGFPTHSPSLGAPITDANVLYTVTTPPAHGTLLLDGAPTSQFTQQNVDDGRVAYQNTGGTSDSFGVFAEVTEVPGVIKPYTPLLPIVFLNDMSPGTTQGAFYAGVTLIGATQMPNLDSASEFYGNWGTVGPSIYFTFATSKPNEVVFAIAYSQGSNTTPSYPAPVSLATINCAGLTFTRLGGGSFNTINYDTIHSVYHYTTVSAELWYATTTAVIPTTNPSATWDTTGPELVAIGFYSWSDLADISHPWGTDPSSIQMYVTNTVPNSLTLNTSAPDHLVRPVAFQINVGDYDGNYGTTNYPPKGFSFLGGGNSSGGTTGDSLIITSGRTAVTTATIPIDIHVPVTPTLTDADLFFQPASSGFVDFTDVDNRRKFVTADGCGQWLGLQGTLPFGVRPSVFLSGEAGDPDIFATNFGEGGPFAITGSIDLAGSGPCCTFQTRIVSGDASEGPNWRLSVSDDGGRTWSTVVKPRGIGLQGQYRTRLRWLKMGQFRQRVIRLECSDSVRRNLVGFYVDDTQGMS